MPITYDEQGVSLNGERQGTPGAKVSLKGVASNAPEERVTRQCLKGEA